MPKPTAAVDEGFLDELRSVERTVAAEKLGKLKNAELGEVLVALGEAKKDKRLKKEPLAEVFCGVAAVRGHAGVLRRFGLQVGLCEESWG